MEITMYLRYKPYNNYDVMEWSATNEKKDLQEVGSHFSVVLALILALIF